MTFINLVVAFIQSAIQSDWNLWPVDLQSNALTTELYLSPMCVETYPVYVEMLFLMTDLHLNPSYRRIQTIWIEVQPPISVEKVPALFRRLKRH